MRTYKSVLRILTHGDDGLKPLLERAHYLQALTRQLRAILECDLAEHIRIANLRENTVILTADTPAWLARIRYQAPILLRHIQSQSGLENIRKIQFKVQPLNDPNRSTTPERTATLSARSGDMITSAASGINHPELSAALHRLSQRSRKKPPSGDT